MICDHNSFKADVMVARLSNTEGGPIVGYTATVAVKCTGCGLSFRFIGIDAGNHHAEPRVSVDGTELRAPIEPATHAKFAPRASYVLPPQGRH